MRDVSDGLLNEKTHLAEQLSTLTEEKEQLIQGNCFVQTSKGSSMNDVTVLRGEEGQGVYDDINKKRDVGGKSGVKNCPKWVTSFMDEMVKNVGTH